ncbi:MAG: ribosome maturation factor RimP [Proteobacteria bacterium]|nr:ribosome maturation factor RimP [Pseudomonadota bacterium]
MVEIGLKQENKNNILEIIVDKDGGISIDQCAEFSKKISLVLDVEDPIPFKYNLEVGSPGIFRELKTEKELQKNLNARVKAVFSSPVKGRKKFVGTLKKIQDRTVFIGNDEQELSADIDQIKKIRLFPKL